MPTRSRASSGSAAEDKELLAIFESTYGKVERRAFEPKRAPARTALDETRYNIKNQKTGPEYLLVDGYNIIFAWDALKKLAVQTLQNPWLVSQAALHLCGTAFRDASDKFHFFE